MCNFRTDLASERRDIYKQANSLENEIDGIESEKEEINENLKIERVKITNEEGEKAIGKPKNARLVGTALKQSSMYGDFPCHRVVHSDGSLTPGWDEQYDLLINEGITFKNKKVDMKRHLYRF
jgi:methylated-DNA-protein-cysteine methyltransferase-like protein